MVSWRVVLSKHAAKDAKKLKRAGLRSQTEKQLQILAADPYSSCPSYEKLLGNLNGFYSRRINIQHRLVYSINDAKKVVHVLRMWSHYE